MNKPGRPLALGTKSRDVKTESQAIEEWGMEASLLIKREMGARSWGYRELSDALQALGIKRSAAVINRRINRGNFTAGFLLICLAAMDAQLVALSTDGAGAAINDRGAKKS